MGSTLLVVAARFALAFAAATSAAVAGCEGRGTQQDNAGAVNCESAVVAADRDASPVHRTFTQDQIKWQDAKALPAGAQMAVLEGDPAKPGFIAMRIKLPSGYRIPPHYHPCQERVTVLSGTFHLASGEKFDEKAGAALTAGAYTTMPAGMRHYAWADGETILQLTTIGPWGITYVNEADDPRRQQTAGR